MKNILKIFCDNNPLNNNRKTKKKQRSRDKFSTSTKKILYTSLSITTAIYIVC